MLKLKKCLMANRIFILSVYIIGNYLLITMKMVTFQWRTLVNDTLPKVTKVNISKEWDKLTSHVS